MKTERSSFHSNDFCFFNDKINGKTQTEHEQEFNIVGEIIHLKDLGWDQYQWRFTKTEDCKPNLEIGSLRVSKQCFAEFFGLHYNGYIRGDGYTVREAVLQCLNKAQSFAACLNHTFESVPTYTTGLIRCSKCGFFGHSSLVQTLQSKIETLTIQLEVEKQFNIQNENRMRTEGITEHEAFENCLKGLAETLINDK